MEQGNPNAVTIIRPTDGSFVGKHVSHGPNGKLRKIAYAGSKAEWWMGREVPVGDIWDLHEVLQDLRGKPDHCVIRGAPLPGVDLSRAHKRRTKVSRKDTHPPAYRDVGRRWMGIDIDDFSYDPTEFDPYGEPEEFFEYMCRQISPDLEDVTVVYQFSTSAGIAQEGEKHNVAKVHLWFWLDRPYTSSEIKRWADGVNDMAQERFPAKPGEKTVQLIDTTPLHPVGILYTSDPHLECVSTSVVRRVGIVDLGKEEARLSIVEQSAHKAINSANFRNSDGKIQGGFAFWVEKLKDLNGATGAHDLIVRAAMSFFNYAGSQADCSVARKAIRDAIQSWTDSVRRDELLERVEHGSELDDAFDSAQFIAQDDERKGHIPVAFRNEQVIEADLTKPHFDMEQNDSPEVVRAKQTAVLEKALGQAISTAVALKRGEETETTRIQITGPVGSGKTSTVEAIIRKLDDVLAKIDPDGSIALNIYFAAGLTAKAAETAEEIPGAVVLRGVGSPDPELDDKKSMCWKPKVAQAVQSEGGDLKNICDACKFKFDCGYRKQIGTVRELEGKTGVRVFTGPHEFLHYPSQVKGGWDIVIVDERYKAEGNKEVFDPKTLLTPIDWTSFAYVPKDEDGAPDEPRTVDGRIKLRVEPEFVDAARRAVRKELIDNAHRILGAIRDLYVPGYLQRLDAKMAGKIAEAFRTVTQAMRPFKDDGSPKFDAGADDDAIIAEFEDIDTRKVRRVAKFFEKIAAEYESRREQSNTVRIEGGKIVLRGYRKPANVGKQTPVILLDATAHEELNRRIWGEIEPVPINGENKAEVVQVLNTSWSKASFLDGKKGDRKQDEVANVINLFPGSFVAAPKAVREAIEPKLGETILTGHYANLRGLNAFSNCETGFLLCDPMVPPVAVLDLALAYGEKDREAYQLVEYAKQTRRFRMRDPERVEVAHQQPICSDPTLEMYRQILVEDEMLQAIGRVRAFWNERTIYILSNRVYDQTIDDVISWDEFRARVAATEIDADAVIDSPYWFTKAYPDVTTSRAKAGELLAALKMTGWGKVEGIQGFSRNGDRFDVIAKTADARPINIEGWTVDKAQEASEDGNLIVAILLKNGFVSTKPDWIVENSGGSVRSKATAKRQIAEISAELIRLTTDNQLVEYNKPNLSHELNSSPWFSVVPTDDGLAPKIEFSKFRYRVKGQRGPASFGYVCGPFDRQKNRIEEALGSLSVLEEVSSSQDANAEADDKITRAKQITRMTGITADRQAEVEAPIRNAAPEIFEAFDGLETISVAEAIRRQEERDASREAEKQYEEAQVDLVEEAIQAEADEKKATEFFDLTPAIKK